MRVVGHRKTKTNISHKVSVLNSKMSMEIDEVMKENSKITRFKITRFKFRLLFVCH